MRPLRILRCSASENGGDELRGVWEEISTTHRMDWFAAERTYGTIFVSNRDLEVTQDTRNKSPIILIALSNTLKMGER